MQSEIIKQLKNLKAIKPEPDFTASAKQFILTAQKPRRFIFDYLQTWVLATTAIVLLIVLTISVADFYKTLSLSKNFINPEEINYEFENLNINIQLQEISYRQSINETIAAALDEISDKKPTYLKTNILEKELNSLKINNGNNQEQNQKIDELLNKIIF